MFSSGLIDLAIKRNSLIGGDDFKSGQTKMKSVLVDFLVGAGIKVQLLLLLLLFFFFHITCATTILLVNNKDRLSFVKIFCMLKL